MTIGLVATRGIDGLRIFKDTDKNGPENWSNAYFKDDVKDRKNCHKAMKFSDDGGLFAYVNEEVAVDVYDTAKNEVICQIPRPRTFSLQFSPKGNYLCCYQPNYAKRTESEEKLPNVTIWDTKTGKKINELWHTKDEYSGFIWAPDDSWYGRISSDKKKVLFFEPLAAEKVVNTIVSADGAPIQAFAVGKGKRKDGSLDPLVAIFTPEFRAQPAKVRVFRYPNFEPNDCLVAKSFFKAEEARLHWSDSAGSLVVLASTAIDKSGQSYYGATQLHHLCTKGRFAGEAAMVPLSPGPVYDIAWEPNKDNFCVVYGFMPSKATVFSSPKLNVVFEVDKISKNQCLFSPGNTGLLALCGFGNLGGIVEVYKTETKTKICEFRSENTTHFEWAADGKHFLASTVTPRLRTDNRVELITATGKRKWRLETDCLWEALFQPRPDLAKEAVKISEEEIKEAQKETKQRQTAEKSRKFIPPHLRRKMEADSGKTNTTDLKSLQNKSKNLKKKLGQIKGLKADQAGGKKLNEEQVHKIKTETSVQKELDEIMTKIKNMS